MSNERTDEPASGYRKTAVSGAVNTGLGTIAKGVIHIVGIVVLARLLAPDDFGLMAMVFPIIAFASIFQEAGLGVAVLQRSAINHTELSTMFWINVAIGLGLAALLIALAPLAAYFYNEPQVAWLTAASGSLIFLASLSTQHIALLNRSLRFRELALIDAISLATGAGIAILVASMYESYWAIFLLSFGTTASKCALAWAFSGWRPGKRAPVRQVYDLISFGSHMTLANLASYFGRNLDNVLIGRVWGATPLGFYERAYKVVLMPIIFVHMPLFRLMVPILSQTRDQPERYRRMFLLGFQASLLLTIPGLVLLVAATDVVVALVMGSKWLDGATIFAWLAVAALTQCITGPLIMLFVSQGRARESMQASVAGSLYICGAFAIGLPWGAEGVAAAYAIGSALRLPVALWYVTRSGPVALSDAFRALLPFLLAAAACFSLIILLAQRLDGRSAPLFYTLAGLVIVYAVTLPCMLINGAGRQGLREIMSLARGFLFGSGQVSEKVAGFGVRP